MTKKRRFGTPPAEVEVGLDLVAGLIADQHPDLAGLPLELIGSGYDNVMVRLGDDYVVRLPRRTIALMLREREQTWLPGIAERVNLPVPTFLRDGVPGRGYPWPWSILQWIPGSTAEKELPDRSQAPIFGAFLKALHVPAMEGLPSNPGRQVALAEHREKIERYWAHVSKGTDLLTSEVREIWEEGVRAPIDCERTLIHGDLHAWNVLVEKGTITGVIDWGDVTAGDPATDLVSLWIIFDDPVAREEVIAAYGGLSSATLRRAKGWAVYFALVMLASGQVDNPAFVLIAERTLRRLTS